MNRFFSLNELLCLGKKKIAQKLFHEQSYCFKFQDITLNMLIQVSSLIRMFDKFSVINAHFLSIVIIIFVSNIRSNQK